MKKIEKYYEVLKQIHLLHGNGFFNNDFPYSKEYPYYFKSFILKNMIKDTPKYIIEEIKNGQCNALISKNNNPPEMLCVASSAMQCLVSLGLSLVEGKDITHLSTFINEDDELDKKTKPHFEKKLKIKNVKGYCPNMDAYFESKNQEYFFECKCREIFDNDRKSISSQYIKDEDHLLGLYLKKDIDYTINRDKYYLDKSKVGSFNLNQFVKHLLGIISNKKTEVSNLIYYYFLPSEKYLSGLTGDITFIEEIIEKAKNDCINAFNLEYVRKICNKYKINLRLFVGDAVAIYRASSDNTHLIYKKDWGE